MIKANINDNELSVHLSSIEPDGLKIFTMADGRVRVAIFHGTRFVNQLRVQHNLGILETYILGQASLCAALTIPMMKDLEHISIRFECKGPADGYSVEADSTGYVRGFLFNEHIPVTHALENWDLDSFLGPGNLTFSRIHKDDKLPQSSTVDVDGNNIARDFATYFAHSEQVNTAFHSSIQFDKKGRVIGAGAMYIQMMPDIGGTARSSSQMDSYQENKDDEKLLLQKIENAFKACPSLGLLYSEKTVDSEDIVIGLFREFNPKIVLNREIIFDCPCNEDYYIRYLRTLPKDQLADIRQNGPDPLEITCRNCGSVYNIPVAKI